MVTDIGVPKTTSEASVYCRFEAECWHRRTRSASDALLVRVRASGGEGDRVVSQNSMRGDSCMIRPQGTGWILPWVEGMLPFAGNASLDCAFHLRNGAWTMQITHNLFDPKDSFLRNATGLIRDRDPLFAKAWVELLKSSEVTSARIPANSPKRNPYAE